MHKKLWYIQKYAIKVNEYIKKTQNHCYVLMQKYTIQYHGYWWVVFPHLQLRVSSHNPRSEKIDVLSLLLLLSFYAPGLKGPLGASSNRILRPFVRKFRPAYK